MFDWLRRLLRKKQTTAEISTKTTVAVERPRIIREQKRDMERGFDKSFKQIVIAEKNKRRQQDTLGFGLKNRNFKPRPGSEKRLWNLQKKPDE